MDLLPEHGAHVLDVGAGSGRDADALAKMGYRVTAVEPSAGMRKLAKEAHPNPEIVWVDDSLPLLGRVLALGRRYQFILVSAVWMHLDHSERPTAMLNLARLLSPKGKMGITLRIGPEVDERSIHKVNEEEVLSLGVKNGLVPLYVGRMTRDPLNRRDVRWKKVAFERRV
ncbi:MAG: class I SAM-dependent methyltransferase [Betaproteobacteria bacterium]|nr:class I SAM-dependent methyltransferase [Betaproteobacteria bacterium]